MFGKEEKNEKNNCDLFRVFHPHEICVENNSRKENDLSSNNAETKQIKYFAVRQIAFSRLIKNVLKAIMKKNFSTWRSWEIYLPLQPILSNPHQPQHYFFSISLFLCSIVLKLIGRIFLQTSFFSELDLVNISLEKWYFMFFSRIRENSYKFSWNHKKTFDVLCSFPIAIKFVKTHVRMSNWTEPT